MTREQIASTTSQVEVVERDRERVVREAVDAALIAAREKATRDAVDSVQPTQPTQTSRPGRSQTVAREIVAPIAASSQTRAHQVQRVAPSPPASLVALRSSQTSHTIENDDDEEDAPDDMSEWMVQDDKYHVRGPTLAPSPLVARSRSLFQSQPSQQSRVPEHQQREEEEEENGTVDFEPTGLADNQIDVDEVSSRGI